MRNKPGWTVLVLMTSTTIYESLKMIQRLYLQSYSNLQNIAFVSENTNSTNEVSTAYGVSHSILVIVQSMNNHQHHHIPCLQINLVILNWIMRTWISSKRRTGENYSLDAKEPVGFVKTKWNASNATKQGNFARECRTRKRIDGGDGWNTGLEEGRRMDIEIESIT
ncbi:hypothetical protein Tco_1476489 [Tanacetum coccineum]